MKKTISRSELHYLQRVAPHPGSGHIYECLSLLRSLWQGWGDAQYYRVMGIHDVNSAIAYLQRTPPDIEGAERLLEALKLKFHPGSDVGKCLSMAVLRIQSYRLEQDLFEVTDDGS